MQKPANCSGGGSYPAGLYMYTSDSVFNRDTMSLYMATGNMIPRPSKAPWVLDEVNFLGNASASDRNNSNFRVIKTTSGESLTVLVETDEENDV